jgi:hypothetical protein
MQSDMRIDRALARKPEPPRMDKTVRSAKITLKQPILTDAERLKLANCMSLGNFCGDFSIILQNQVISRLDELVQATSLKSSLKTIG